MHPFLVTPPTGDVVPLDAELRRHCRVDGTDDDAVIASNVAAAVSHLDGYTGALGRCILAQRWAVPVPETVDTVVLPFPDCRAFTVERLAGDTWTVEAGVTVTPCLTTVRLDGLPSDRTGLHVLMDAGWADAFAVPEALKQAVRMLAAHWYENRGAATTGYSAQEVPMAAQMLLRPFKYVGA